MVWVKINYRKEINALAVIQGNTVYQLTIHMFIVHMKMAGGDIWANFGVESMVCGYHCYSLIWNAVIEEIFCKLELNNPEDKFAVSVCQRETTVGHVPRRISSICSSFL